MRVAEPIDISSRFEVNKDSYDPIYSTHDEWDNGDAYIEGDEVTHEDAVGVYYNYRSVRSQSGNNPANDDGTNWIRTGSDQIFQIFDGIIRGQSTNGTPGLGANGIWKATASDLEYLTFDITSATADVVAIFGSTDRHSNFDDPTLSNPRIVILDDEDNVIYDVTKYAIFADAQDWYEFLSEPLENPVTLFTEVPITGGAEMRVYSRFQEIVVAKETVIGDNIFPGEIDFLDLSIFERDEFGSVSITERESYDRAKYSFSFPTERVNFVRRFLEGLRSTLCLFYTDEDDDQYGMTTLGFFRDVDLPIQPGKVNATIEVEGI